MPIYDYECSACETVWETMQSIDENIEDPPTHCMKCDPEEVEKGTLYRYFGNTRPAFDLRGEGFSKPGWH
jgi:putative FmdB family regulatory protein